MVGVDTGSGIVQIRGITRCRGLFESSITCALVSVYFIYKLYSRHSENRVTLVGDEARVRIDDARILLPVEMLMNDGNITTRERGGWEGGGLNATRSREWKRVSRQR